jgi:hypothetical protein
MYFEKKKKLYLKLGITSQNDIELYAFIINDQIEIYYSLKNVNYYFLNCIKSE